LADFIYWKTASWSLMKLERELLVYRKNKHPELPAWSKDSYWIHSAIACVEWQHLQWCKIHWRMFNLHISSTSNTAVFSRIMLCHIIDNILFLFTRMIITSFSSTIYQTPSKIVIGWFQPLWPEWSWNGNLLCIRKVNTFPAQGSYWIHSLSSINTFTDGKW